MVESTPSEGQAATNQPMDVWIGSDLGIVKSSKLSTGTFLNHGKLEGITKTDSISSMAWHGEGESQILVGRQNGVVKCFDTSSQTLIDSGTACILDSKVVGVASLLGDGSMCAAVGESGMLRVWTGGLTEQTVDRTIGDNICCMAVSSDGKHLAAGGKENNLKVWAVDQLEEKQAAFQAKNVKNDFLNLRVPVHVTSTAFLGDDSGKVVTGTNFHQLRMYDPKTQKRPVLDAEWHEHPITSCAVLPDNNRVLCGNSAGYLATLDLRMAGRQVGGFKGSAGSVRAVCAHSSQPLIASAGLDRFLRVYNVNTRKCVKKIYMKSAMNCLLMTQSEICLEEEERKAGVKRSATDDIKDEPNEGDSDEDAEEIWEGMETVKDQKKKLLSKKKKQMVSGDVIKVKDEE